MSIPDFWNKFLPCITWDDETSLDETIITIKGEARSFLNEKAMQFAASNHKSKDTWKVGLRGKPHRSTYEGLLGEFTIAYFIGQEPNLTIGADNRGDLFLPLANCPVIEVKTTHLDCLMVRCATHGRRLPMNGDIFVCVKILSDSDSFGPDDITQVQILGVAHREELLAQPDSPPRTSNPNANWLNKEIHSSRLHSFGDWLTQNLDLINPWWNNSDIPQQANFSNEVVHSLPGRESQIPHAHS